MPHNRFRGHGRVGWFGFLLLMPVGSLSPTVAAAQDAIGGEATEPVVSQPSPEPEPTQHDVIPIFMGDTAPWTGLLVPEGTFADYLRLDLRTQELEGLVSIKTELIEQLQLTYEGAMREVASPNEESWWSKYGFTVGIIGGIIVGGALAALGGWLASLQ